MPAHTPISLKVCSIAWDDLPKRDRDRIAAARARLAAHVGKIIHEKVNVGGKN